MRWVDRLYAARDRLLGNEDFQAWAAGFPVVRLIARRRARALFDLTAGFVYAQVLSAVVRLSLLERLRDAPQTAPGLAPTVGLSVDSTERLLKAAAALGLVVRRGRDAHGARRWGLGMDGAALLGNPGVAAMIAHHDLVYGDLADPVALLRGERPTRLAGFWPYATEGAAADSDVAPYTALMSASQPLVARDILDGYDFSRHRHLLDAGGGNGTFLSAVLARAPALQGTVFDLPRVAALARERFADAALADRAKAVGGDLWHDPLPGNADVISLVRVLHDHDDAAVASLLSRIARALPAGGALIIAEPMVDGRDGPRVGDAYFGFYLLAMGSGRARTPDDYVRACREAGFAHASPVRLRRPLLCSMIVARMDNVTHVNEPAENPPGIVNNN